MKDESIEGYIELIKKISESEHDFDFEDIRIDDDSRLGQVLAKFCETVQKKLEKQRQLFAITQKINSGLMLDEVLEFVYSEFQGLIPFDRIGFALLENDGAVLRARWAKSASSNVKITYDYSAPIKGSSLQRILEDGRPRILNDLRLYLKDHPESESTRLIVEEGILSSLTCPLVAMEKPIGFIFFSSMKTETYKDIHVDTFVQLAGQLAIIAEKGRLYQEVKELSDLKTKFLGIAAHDMRNPIAAIKGFTSLLKEGIIKGVEAEKAIQRILANCDGLMTLINDLLDISAIESGKLEVEKAECEIADFLLENVEMNRILAKGKSINIQTEIDENIQNISLEQKRINQVLNNLITNAIKFSEPQTNITLRAKNVAGGIQIDLKDEGQGIQKDDIPLLFQEFSKTSTRPTAGEKSTGLGLAIVKKIVEAHSGKVWVESEYGQGTTFSFFLPAASEGENPG